jgi:hypothetical protein
VGGLAFNHQKKEKKGEARRGKAKLRKNYELVSQKLQK